MNEYILKNYIDDKGKEPVKIWLKTLDATVRKRILLRDLILVLDIEYII